MLVNTYAHIQQSSRVELGKKFEEGFYAKQESLSPQAVPAAGEPTISMTALLELLKNSDPCIGCDCFEMHGKFCIRSAEPDGAAPLLRDLHSSAVPAE